MATNVDRSRRWYSEVWKPGGEATVQELMADRLDGYMEGVDVHTRDEFLAERSRLLGAFPDLRIEVDDVRGWDSWNLGGLLSQLGAPSA